MLSKELLNLLDGLFEGAYIVDKHRKILYWNDSAVRITGFEKENVVNMHCFNNILMHVDNKGTQLCLNGCPLQKTIETGEVLENNVYLHHKLGHRIPVIVRTSPLYNENNEIYAALEVFTDSRYQKSLYFENKRLHELSTRDPLTKLYNRSFINYKIDNFIEEYHVFSQHFGVVFIDIDDFKTINDTYGHNTGDDVLKMLSRTVVSNIREEDVFGRYGGEEFILICKVINDSELFMIADKLRILIQNSSIISNKNLIKITVSMGARLFSKLDHKDSLIDKADKAMYQSKHTGKNKVTIYEGE